MTRTTQKLLATYPRTRPALPEKHARLYMDEYKVTRTKGKKMPLISKITSRFNHWMHLKVANGHTAQQSILEIGGGTLNHLGFEPKKATYDVIEPFEYLLQGNVNLKRVRHFHRDMRDAAGKKYDHIVSVAVLEHLAELPYVVAQSGLMLKKGGSFQAGIPSEGGLAWGVMWRVTTGLAYYLRHGFGKGPLMKHEHINDADEIEAVVKQYFAKVKVRRFPLPLRHLSVYTYIEATEPKLEICQKLVKGYLKKQPKPFEKVTGKFKKELGRIRYS